jgi:hypothetical protein
MENIQSVFTYLTNRIRGVSETMERRNIYQIKLNSIEKGNWNFFVGDKNYKTDFFLRFYGANVDSIYQHSLMASNQYTVRLLLLVFALINFKLQSSIQLTDSSDFTGNLHNALISRWVILITLILGLFGSLAMSLTVFQR